MTYQKNIWEDRIVQYPNRYKDQNDNLLTLIQEPGEVAQLGTLVDADKMNNIENGIEDASKEINSITSNFSGKDITDCNEVEKNGVFHTTASTLNCPIDGSAGFLTSMVESNKLTRIQYWTRYRDNQIYMREYNKVNANSNGTDRVWSDWEDISVYNLKNYVSKKVAVGTYNGKTLYRQMFTFGALTKDGLTTIATLKNLDTLFVIHDKSFLKNGNQQFPLVKTHISNVAAQTDFRFDYSTGIVQIGCGSAVTVTSGVLTLEFTEK